MNNQKTLAVVQKILDRKYPGLFIVFEKNMDGKIFPQLRYKDIGLFFSSSPQEILKLLDLEAKNLPTGKKLTDFLEYRVNGDGSKSGRINFNSGKECGIIDFFIATSGSPYRHL